MKKVFITAAVALTITCVLFSGGCKEDSIPTLEEVKYSVVGTWAVDKVYVGITYIRNKINCTFSGSLEYGTVTSDSGGNGIYVVGGEHGVSINFS